MIVIATPTRDSVTAGCAADLIKLCRRYPDARFISPLGIYISLLRDSSVSASRQIGASHVLFIDSDMRFPEDALGRLMAAGKDIIGANYPQRMAPHLATAWDASGPVTSAGKSGSEEVHSLGFGLVLIRLGVFDLLPRPWFDTPWNGTTYVGEDVQFCRSARKAGLSVWIDHDLSRLVKHQGATELGVELLVSMEAVA